MWTPSYLDFQNLFSNDFTLKILLLLHQKKDKSLIPTEIADILSIHVSTAKKYLELLFEHDLVSKNKLMDKPGRPTLYTLLTKDIQINLNLESLSGEINSNIDKYNPLIREKSIDKNRVAYKFTKDGLVDEIQVKKTTKAKKQIKISFQLSSVETQFMKYLPHPTKRPVAFLDLCTRARIFSITEIKIVEQFMKKLVKYDIIESNLER